MQAKPEATESRAEEVLRKARARNITIATAESCTAGALASLLAGAPGAAEVFHGGFIVYTKEQKKVALGVPAALIQQHTAVSAEVAQAMALGAIERSPADLAISITGVLGPEPDEDGNPVGLVFFGLVRRSGPPQIRECRFNNDTKEKINALVLKQALLFLEAGMARHD